MCMCLGVCVRVYVWVCVSVVSKSSPFSGPPFDPCTTPRGSVLASKISQKFRAHHKNIKYDFTSSTGASNIKVHGNRVLHAFFISISYIYLSMVMVLNCSLTLRLKWCTAGALLGFTVNCAKFSVWLRIFDI